MLSPLALSFYEGCIRARNDKLKAALGVKLRYPTYRDGLQALHEPAIISPSLRRRRRKA